MGNQCAQPIEMSRCRDPWFDLCLGTLGWYIFFALTLVTDVLIGPGQHWWCIRSNSRLKAVTWKMESADLATGRVVMVMLFSTDSHSWMVTMLRAGGEMWRCVSRAFFRWWKSPSVRVYLGLDNIELNTKLQNPYKMRHSVSCVISYTSWSLSLHKRQTAKGNIWLQTQKSYSGFCL